MAGEMERFESMPGNVAGEGTESVARDEIEREMLKLREIDERLNQGRIISSAGMVGNGDGLELR